MLLSLALWPQADAGRGSCDLSPRRIPIRFYSHPGTEIKEGLALGFKLSQALHQETLSMVRLLSPSESQRTIVCCAYSFVRVCICDNETKMVEL